MAASLGDVRSSLPSGVASRRWLLRVAEIVSGSGVNGAMKHCLMLSRELARRGHRVTLVCRPGSWIDAHAGGGWADVERSDLNRWPADELRRVARLVRERRIDVVHTHMSRAHFFGVLLGALARVPVVATAHARRVQAHWIFNDHVIAVSNAVARFQRWNLVPARRITLVHLFIDTDEFVPPDDSSRHRARATMGIAASAPLVGVIGSVFREKGVQDLIAAWPAIVAAVPDAHLVVIGEGPADLVRDLRAALEAWNLQSRATWLGRRDDVAQLIGSVDVLALPSREEPAGLVALEAMAAGRPVVGTRVGGVPEYVADGETGILVERANPPQLAAALTGLLSNPRLAHAYGGRGRARVLDRFTLPAQVSKIEAVLERVAARGRRKGETVDTHDTH